VRLKNIILLVLVFLVSKVSFSQNDAGKMEIMMKMLTLKNALIAKDSVALSKVLGDDVTYGHTNAMIQTKSELIRDVVSKVQDYKSIEPSDMKIRLFDNSAIVNMNAKIVLNYKNEPMELKMKITLVWIKQNNDWVLEARQAVKILE
jgi:hypothetical protein